jgi:hypothetical protein
MPETSLRPARILVGCIHGEEGIEAAAYRIESQPLIVIFDNDQWHPLAAARTGAKRQVAA